MVLVWLVITSYIIVECDTPTFDKHAPAHRNFQRHQPGHAIVSAITHFSKPSNNRVRSLPCFGNPLVIAAFAFLPTVASPLIHLPYDTVFRIMRLHAIIVSVNVPIFHRIPLIHFRDMPGERAYADGRQIAT